MKFTDK